MEYSCSLKFFTLFFGSIFRLLWIVGKDLISVVSFLVSDDNLNKNDEALLISSTAEYLKTCINGDGNLKDVLYLNIGSMNYIENLKNASDELKNVKTETCIIKY